MPDISILIRMMRCFLRLPLISLFDYSRRRRHLACAAKMLAKSFSLAFFAAVTPSFDAMPAPAIPPLCCRQLIRRQLYLRQSPPMSAASASQILRLFAACDAAAAIAFSAPG